MEYLLLIASLFILIVSGELLVKGAVGLAYRFRISTLVIGMTVVSFGTSAPELLVSIQAALAGHPDISFGNVIGSNISNIALVLGITALIFPISVDKNSIRIDWPLMFGATLLLYFLILDKLLGFVEGLFFVALLTFIVVWLIRNSRKKELQNAAKDDEDIHKAKLPILKSILFIIIGCVGLVFGANWFLEGAVDIAKVFGVSDRVIGVTLVAFGTSVPELITSVVAAFRKESNISIGNLIGSNLFNILGILGITGMVKTITIDEKILNFDMFWLIGISAIIFPLMWFGRKITRLKGVFLLLIYVVYIVFVLAG